jgi:hypothetical protein
MKQKIKESEEKVNTCPLTAEVSNPDRDEVIQLAYGISVVLLRCLFVPEIM